ncbi:type II toxin-antitoxin system HicB family antitoxin [Thermogemmatispora tikiterensis]
MYIQWSAEDQAYVVTVPELPGCQTHGSTYEEAIRRGQEAIESWISAALAMREPLPPPRTLISPPA